MEYNRRDGKQGQHMRKTRIDIAKPDIVKHFEEYPVRVFRRSQIEEILSSNRNFWRLTQTMTVNEFLEYLLDKTKLKAVKLKFPSRTETRYVWNDAVSVYQLALSLKSDSYFTHYTAMFLHGLTEQIPKTVYLNFEQSSEGHFGASLEQKNIDWAFRRKPRISNNIAVYGDQRICVLNGKYTGRRGVIELEDEFKVKIQATNVERTLIDIAVRPFYAGGVFEVIKAYRLAKDKVSINKMVAMLKELDYVYPYHQAIGFYLERAGVYRASVMKLLKKLGIQYDFYLTYQMKEMDYSQDWRLYFPKGL
jgi:hypothetical protein